MKCDFVKNFKPKAKDIHPCQTRLGVVAFEPAQPGAKPGQAASENPLSKSGRISTEASPGTLAEGQRQTSGPRSWPPSGSPAVPRSRGRPASPLVKRLTNPVKLTTNFCVKRIRTNSEAKSGFLTRFPTKLVFSDQKPQKPQEKAPIGGSEPKGRYVVQSAIRSGIHFRFHHALQKSEVASASSIMLLSHPASPSKVEISRISASCLISSSRFRQIRQIRKAAKFKSKETKFRKAGNFKIRKEANLFRKAGNFKSNNNNRKAKFKRYTGTRYKGAFNTRYKGAANEPFYNINPTLLGLLLEMCTVFKIKPKKSTKSKGIHPCLTRLGVEAFESAQPGVKPGQAASETLKSTSKPGRLKNPNEASPRTLSEGENKTSEPRSWHPSGPPAVPRTRGRSASPPVTKLVKPKNIQYVSANMQSASVKTTDRCTIKIHVQCVYMFKLVMCKKL